MAWISLIHSHNNDGKMDLNSKNKTPIAWLSRHCVCLTSIKYISSYFYHGLPGA